MIVDVFKSLASGVPIPIRSPRALRPWQHVLQCLSGYLTIVARLLGHDAANYCSGWNIGPMPGNELPVREVVEHFIACWGSGQYIDASDPNQPPEANILRLCIDKAIWKLRWRPRWSVYESLERTAVWYRGYLQDPDSIRSVSLAQINEYEEALAAPLSTAPIAAGQD